MFELIIRGLGAGKVCRLLDVIICRQCCMSCYLCQHCLGVDVTCSRLLQRSYIAAQHARLARVSVTQYVRLLID
jgi:hypothetical protein